MAKKAMKLLVIALIAFTYALYDNTLLICFILS